MAFQDMLIMIKIAQKLSFNPLSIKQIKKRII
jgi:hypothetical protein